MNVKRYLIATVALFVFLCLYGMLVHGMLLSGMYEASAQIWRDYTEMQALAPFRFIFQIVLAAWAVLAFSQFYKKGGVKHGLLFGLFFGVFAGILAAMKYLWLPISGALCVSWFIANTVEWVLGGLILGYIYRK